MSTFGLLRRTSVLMSLLAVSAAVAQAGEGSARLETYARPTGEAYFALSLSPSGGAIAPTASDVVVLFDTSASQTGQFRTKSLEALESLLAALSPRDRVQLLAVDLKAVPLTAEFVAPQGGEIREAIAELERRVPLGSTDMGSALATATDCFEGGLAAGTSRAVVYIGDGMSTANLLAGGEIDELAARFVEKRAALNSFAIGPRIDSELLAVMANHTGGVVLLDTADINGGQAGNDLAAATRRAVAWPLGMELPSAMAQVYPRQTPPLRFDRDAILVGQGQFDAAIDVRMTVEVLGQRQQWSWQVQPAAPQDDNAYLVKLVDAARRDGGATLPTAGSMVLDELRRLAQLEAHNLTRLGQQAVAVGSLDQAQTLADGAMRLDPTNPEALAVHRAVEKARQGGGKARELQLVNFQPAEELPPAPPTAEQPAGLLDEVERNRRIVEAMIQAEVQSTLNSARAIMAVDPLRAQSDLKMMGERVRQAPELGGEVRQQLLNQVESALQAAAIRQVQKEEQDLARQRVEAAAAERQQLLNETLRTDERIDQLIERFNALLDERRYRDASQSAEQARDLKPDSAALAGAVRTAETGRAVYEVATTQAARWLGYQDTMFQVERSGVPTPDEPSILYPSADKWLLLTEARRKYRRVDLSQTNESETKILDALDEKTELEFIEAPLTDVIDYLKQRHAIEIQLDNKSMEDEGIAPDTPITRELRNVTLRSALRLTLSELDLAYVIENEVLLITTRSQAEEKRTTRVYPVADLVIPIPQGGLSGFGGLGGMMGGGMMGGGMGGGMGGLGGGGAGLGGGGMFNVPAEADAEGLRAFAVKDELKLSSKTPADTAAPADAVAPAVAAGPEEAAGPASAPQAQAEATSGEVRPIQLTIEPGADVAGVWDDHFAANTESPAAVRETVRRLATGRKHDHVVALINAALRHDQGQSWMYEALGLAMLAGGATGEDIERALLSALDFSTDAGDLYHVAYYLARHNLGDQRLKRRALSLLRQFSRIQPLRPEPYVIGLQLARDLDDLEALEWTTIGILSQAWTGEQQELWHTARRVAQATVERLQSQQRGGEAEALAKAIKEAMVRDCVVVISWTGEADIDLLVEEPAGTVCSFRNPRTVSGGVLVGESAVAEAATSGGSSEVYVCPQGFNGDYRMLLRRVWGKLTTDSVTVDIFLHHGSPAQKHHRKVVRLGDDDAVLAFELQNGRRTEPLAEQQVATAVAGQLALGRQILSAMNGPNGGTTSVAGQLAAGRRLVAQQIAAAADPRVLAQLIDSPSLDSLDGLIVPVPVIGAGAVGYQPVIITLPEGANTAITAVVSHDRRYVRITAQPLFSTIPVVNTFNYVSGSGGTSGGGTGS